VKRRSLAAVLLVVVVSLMATPTWAARKPTPTTFPSNSSTPPPGQPTINSWALAPTGRDPSQPSSRIYLSYDVAPGSQVNDSVTLWNYSNVQLTFHIYATDAFNTPNGAFDLLTGEKAPTDAGSWVKLPQANITAAARSKIDIPFNLAVPANARPGDHAGAVLAANDIQGTGPDGKVVTLDRRTGSRLYVRVSGPVTPALTIDNVHAVYHSKLNPLGGSLDVTYTVRNSGNVRLQAHQKVEGAGPFGIGKKTHKPADLPELLPNNAITLHQHFTGMAALLRSSGNVVLQPFSSAPDVKVNAPVHRAGHTWAIPWSIVVLLLAIWLVRKTYLPIARRRREMTAGSPPPAQEHLTPVP
jgi:hypothetical protein